jgi:hypothetical protein
MSNDDFEFDAAGFAALVDNEKLAKISAKVEVAKIMMERAMALAEEVRTEIKFYSVIADSAEDLD